MNTNTFWSIAFFLVPVLAAMLAMSSSAGAQDGLPLFGGVEYEVGKVTYGQYDTDRGPVSARFHDVGKFRYGYFSDGSVTTSYRVGRFRYTDYANPSRPTDWIHSRYYAPRYR